MPGTYSPLHDPDDERAGLKSFDSDLDPELDALDIDIDDTLSREQRRREWWRNASINSFFIAIWFGFATVLSIYNKWMFSADKFGFPSPLFVTGMHMCMQFLLAALARWIFPKTFGSPHSPTLKQYGALGGFRWALTQILLTGHGGPAKEDEQEPEPMGMDNPCATIFWLAPTMAVTMLLLCAVVDGFGTIFGSKFFNGFEQTLKTAFFLTAPGTVAFCMTLAEYYIIQRTGMVPMSVAGIFKEVTTISLSAVVFGDKLNELNILGVAITITGIGLFTYHKYRKSVDAPPPSRSRPIRLQQREEPSSDPPRVLFDAGTPSTAVPTPRHTRAVPAAPALRSPRPPMAGKKSVRFEQSEENLLGSDDGDGGDDSLRRDREQREEERDGEQDGLLENGKQAEWR
ncbi:Triose-phosphate Transporter [Ceratobasidium sp. 370]|nr:Triose-phosphate Transporter [Ceratobasidium sp. 370]